MTARQFQIVSIPSLQSLLEFSEVFVFEAFFCFYRTLSDGVASAFDSSDSKIVFLTKSVVLHIVVLLGTITLHQNRELLFCTRWQYRSSSYSRTTLGGTSIASLHITTRHLNL